MRLNFEAAHALCRKYKRAVVGKQESEEAFEALDSGIDKSKTDAWREAEKLAMQERGEALDIYHVRNIQGMLFR